MAEGIIKLFHILYAEVRTRARRGGSACEVEVEAIIKWR